MAPAPVSSGMPPIPETGAAPLRDSARGLLDGRSAPQFGAMERNVGVLMEALRDEGPDGVRRALLAMGRPAARDVAARLAGDKVLSFETMTPRQKVDLITARVLRRWSQALGDDPAAVQARELSDAIEAEAFPEAPPLDIERARAFGAKAPDKPKVAHPVHAELKLPLEKDGTVLMFRGDDPARPPKGKFGGRIFTTDLVRALRNAPAGDVMVVRVTPEELAQVDPRKTTVRGRPAVKPDESTFTLSEALAGRARAFKDEPEMRARAAQAARGGLRDAGLKDLAGKTLQRATKRAAGAILKGLEAGIKDTVAHPKEAKLKLVLEDDGTVLMFQGRTAGKTPGPVGARVFTTDVERALRDSPEGDIRVVRVPKEQLKDADPRLTGGKIAAGEKVFVLSEELAGLAERMEGVPDMLRQAVREALDKAPEAALMRSMDDVEMLLRMREVIEECKL